MLRLVTKSMKFKKKRILLLVLSVAIAASLLLTTQIVNNGFRSIVNEASEKYGANTLVLPTNFELSTRGVTQTYIYENITQIINEPSLPILLVFGKLFENEVVVAGAVFERIEEVNPAWKLEVDNVDNSSAILGKRLAETYDLKQGDEIETDFDGRKFKFKVAGTLSSGSSEDGYLFVDLEVLQKTTGKEGKLSMLMVKSQNPYAYSETDFSEYSAEAIPVEQAIKTKNLVLEKIGTIMAIISAFVFFAALVGVLSISRSDAAERVMEIGIMKAMGMKIKRISSFFLIEHLILGAISAALGILIGLASSYFISAYSTPFPVQITLEGILLALGASVLASLLAAGVYAFKACRTDPAKELKGE